MRYSILITSDTITESTDKSGKLLENLLRNEHKLILKLFCRNNVKIIQLNINKMIKAKSEFIFCIGGTGISRKDLTIDAVKPIIRREIPGFSELFRQLSYKDIGTRAMLSRAMMGIASGNTVICCLPGSANAIQLATTKIILPECDHIIAELNK